MTLKLILMRHAKSAWGVPTQDDHDRPLKPRGRRAAVAMARWLASQNAEPDQVLCSDAVRARQTWAIIADELASKAQLSLHRDLYLAGPQDMLDILGRKGAAPTVMMLGHNPGTAMMAAMLAAERADNRDFDRYPTGFTTILTFAMGNWQAVNWGAGEIVACVAPRKLTG